MHYGLKLPPDLDAPVRIDVQVKYRKFDQRYFDYFTGRSRPGDPPIRGASDKNSTVNPLPIVVLAADSVVLPVEGVATEGDVPGSDESEAATSARWKQWPLHERWNDYGIGLFREGKSELRQAADAFKEVQRLGRYDGPLNLTRVLHREGRINEAVDALEDAAKMNDPTAPSWTLAWLSGLLNREQGYLEEAERNLRSVLSEPTAAMRERGFDFRLDYEVVNLLGQVLFDQANRLPGERNRERREAVIRQAIEQFERTLELDSENVAAHHNLALLYGRLGNQEASRRHRELHARYKPDPNARDRAVALARQRYPAANHAAEPLVIYSLGLPDSRKKTSK